MSNDSTFCPDCGHQVNPGAVGSMRDGEVYLMLLTANVLRLRREWEQAEAKCSGVLSHDPQNASACSVMGDIARDQGTLREAIEWYKMALDRNPGSAPERRKLEALIDRVFATPPQGPVKKSLAALSRLSASAAAEVRLARPPGPLALVVGTVLAVILLIAVSTALLGRKVGMPAPQTSQIASGSFSPPTSAAISEVEKTPVPPPKPLPEAPLDLVTREPELLEHLHGQARQVDPNCQMLGVEIDPRDGVVEIRISMPRLWSVTAMREGILRVAVGLAASVVNWDGRIPRVRTRCSLRGPGGPEQLALVAEGTKEQIVTLNNATTAQVERSLDSIWWTPELRDLAPRVPLPEG